MSATAEKKRFWTPGRLLALIFVAALAIRVAAELTRQMIQLDETAYVRMAQNIASGNGLTEISGLSATQFSPLLPLFIAGIAAIVRSYVVAGYLVVAVFGSLIVVPVYLLSRQLLGVRVALAAAALVAVTPLMVEYSSLIYSESVYIFFLMMAIVFARHMLRGCRIPCGILTGASLGMAYLANPSAVYYLVAVVVLAAIIASYYGTWPQMARALLVFFIFFAIYAAPYVLFLHSQLGSWTYSGKNSGDIFAATNQLRVNGADWEQQTMALTDSGDIVAMQLQGSMDPVAWYIGHPLQAARVFVQQSQLFYTTQLYRVVPLWLLPLMGVGLFSSVWGRRQAAGFAYMAVMMLPALIILTIYAHDRFFMPFLPLALIWAALGWMRLETWALESIEVHFSGLRRDRLRQAAPWAVGALVLVPLLLYAGLTVKQAYDTQYREAGEAIAAAAGAGQRIMSREYSSSYYADGTMVALPYADYAATTAYARAKGADFLVIGRQLLPQLRPGLEPLLTEGGHPDWQLLADIRPGSDQETLVYQLRN